MWNLSHPSHPSHSSHPLHSSQPNTVTRSAQSRLPLPLQGGARVRQVALLGALLVGVALLAGCGASSSSAGSASFSQHSAAGSTNVYGPSVPVSTSQASGGTSSQSSSQPASQYLIKSLNVGMTLPDTRVAASQLTQWITTTDPSAQTAGATYSQDGNQYDVTLTYSVAASYYDQVKAYLTNYADQNKGKLLSLQESVQDVTNDFVDSQSQLSNLRVEQARLQTFMSQAQNVTDLLSVEQRLTDVEGQIQQIEAHLKQLTGQTSYYTVQIQLTPLSSYVPPITQPWSPGAIFQAALSSAKAFGEGLLTVLIWLAVYAIYIVPVGIIAWLIVRYRRRRQGRLAQALASAQPTPPAV